MSSMAKLSNILTVNIFGSVVLVLPWFYLRCVCVCCRYPGVNSAGTVKVLDVPVYGLAGSIKSLGTISGHTLR